MPESTDLTTRDVLSQVDRRVTRIEDDLRTLAERIEQRFADLEARFERRFADLEARFEQRFSTLEAKVDRHFRWQLGISLMLWLSVMTKLFTM